MTDKIEAVDAAIACFEEIIAHDDQHAYTARVGLTALRAALASQQEVAAPVGKPALVRFNASIGDEPDPIERLRFFCSIAMNGQDWIDVEPLFDALAAASRVPVASVAVGNELGNLIACFDAAFAEGLSEALAETTDERLKDLVERRLIYGYWEAVAPSPTPLQGQGLNSHRKNDMKPTDHGAMPELPDNDIDGEEIGKIIADCTVTFEGGFSLDNDMFASVIRSAMEDYARAAIQQAAGCEYLRGDVGSRWCALAEKPEQFVTLFGEPK